MANEVLSALNPYVYRAPYVDAEIFANIEELCLGVLDVEGLQHVSYYMDGILGLSFDVLERTDLLTRPGRSGRPERRRRDLESFGRQINRAIVELNRVLDPLDTGTLIRVVFDSGRGGLLYGRINSRQYLVGATVHAGAFDKADVAMSTLATRCRALLGLSSQNPGGTEKRPSRPRPASRVASHVSDRPAPVSPADHRFAELAREAVRPDDLHYVARCHEGAVNIAVDVFDAPELHSFFFTVSTSRHRDLYAALCRDLPVMTAGFARAARAAMGAAPVRLVLDVEAGALCVHDAGHGEYLLGVTLDQQQVGVTEKRFRDLADRFLDTS
ncbi:hypothetical protein [Parafrankia discariae]|uniref:hypothetical protein n=1 Tax=Parafrankia discariae TaxID=365528 RepID=UPI000369DFEF|nr:hypothetical protein [Parafrankia discariae]